jgi:hypothetical protein
MKFRNQGGQIHDMIRNNNKWVGGEAVKNLRRPGSQG